MLGNYEELRYLNFLKIILMKKNYLRLKYNHFEESFAFISYEHSF